jgi:hypothetical protein
MSISLKACWLIVVPISAFALGCGGASDPPPASCYKRIVFSGSVYNAYGKLAAPAAGRSVGDGVRPACPSDDGGDGGLARAKVDVLRAGGASPAVAVRVAGETTLFLAEGFITAVPEHPLHRRIYGSDRDPRPPRGDCSTRRTFAGTVSATPARGSELSLRPFSGGEDAIVRLHARTRILGFARAGLPYLRAGDRVKVFGLTCRRAGSETFVASRIEPDE